MGLKLSESDLMEHVVGGGCVLIGRSNDVWWARMRRSSSADLVEKRGRSLTIIAGPKIAGVI